MIKCIKRNWPSLLLALGLLVVFIGLVIGCQSPTANTQFKTISAAETSVNAAYSAYVDLVVTGKIPTNSVPQVASAFNSFQSAAHVAIVNHGLNLTNAPPEGLANLAANIIILIRTAEGK